MAVCEPPPHAATGGLGATRTGDDGPQSDRQVLIPSAKELRMCMNCGCGEIDERHGDDANIIADDVRRGAAANGQDLPTTTRNLETSLRQMSERGMAAS